MTVEKLLQRLDKVRQTGPGKWSACCPSHDDKGPSLAVRELDDGRVLLHCFAGCGAAEVLGAIGMEFAELFPKTASYHLPKVRKPWSARDALIGLAFESMVLLQYAQSLAAGNALIDTDRSRLFLSATRIQRAQEATQ